MRARTMLLAVAMGAAAAMTSCSSVVPDSSPGPTLAPLETLPLPSSSTPDDEVEAQGEDGEPDAGPDAEQQPTTSMTLTTTPTSTTSSTTTLTSTISTPTSTTEPAATTTVPRNGGLVNGVQATVGGRNLSFASSCRDGRAVKLDGVTWAFGGNSFRFSGDDDERSEAELIGDGWTMPMLVGSVQSGVYTYSGVPVDGSISSAQVVIDHRALPNC